MLSLIFAALLGAPAPGPAQCDSKPFTLARPIKPAARPAPAAKPVQVAQAKPPAPPKKPAAPAIADCKKPPTK
jgi:hypothetical protein